MVVKRGIPREVRREWKWGDRREEQERAIEVNIIKIYYKHVWKYEETPYFLKFNSCQF
jgi:hypothetical protein